ncbi:unnamed protein product, partial [Mesorhabditis belari]|uniref:RNase NYN domain-containing protein n=1 Tax=Mesorhabditis belari TaxID=2138241 RepID=A0AAF3EWG9_9BILA
MSLKMSHHSTSIHCLSTASTQLTSNSLDKHEEVDTEAPFDPLFVPPSSQAVRRLLVVDGCNIARSSCGPTRNNVNCAGLMVVIRWLLVRKFEVVAFLPIIYNNNGNFNVTNVYLLQKLEELGVVTFTPARTARGDRRAFINYDDLYVASLAARHGGTVLSGDRFKDILAETQYNELHDVLRNRRLDVRFHILKHPYAQIGEDRFIDRIPELCLRPADQLNDAISKRLWAERNDPDYQKVLLRRRSWSKQQSDRMVATIDLLMDELCEKTAIRPIQLSPPYTQWIAQKGMRNGGGRFVDSSFGRPGPSTTTPSTSLSLTPPVSYSSRYSEDSVISWNGDFVDLRGRNDQQQRGDGGLVTEDGYSNVPGLWIPPELRQASAHAHQDLAPVNEYQATSGDGGVEAQERRTMISIQPEIGTPPSASTLVPLRFTWKDVDLLTLNVADLHYCLNHPRNDVLVLPSCSQQRESLTNEDHVLAQLIDAFPMEIVEKVLKENISRNVEVLANLCAEMTT